MQDTEEKFATWNWLWFGPAMALVWLVIGDRIILRRAFGQTDSEASSIKHPPVANSDPSRVAWLAGRPILGELLLISLQLARVVIAWLTWRAGGWLASPIWLLLGWRALVYRNAMWDGAEVAFSSSRGPRG